jgi:succinate dehydrogenase / fumarate reductase flavoprotein subunit
MRQPKIIVVGGGLAGLMATIRVAEAGIPVDLFSIVPVKRSHSVCAQGGINAAKNQKGEGDTVDKHFDDTIYGGDFLANQPLVKRMCEAAPGIIDLLDRMGVMFNRTPEGLLDYRRFGGTLYHRTAFAGATTGQQLLYALDEQVRRHEAEGKVKKFEGATFLSAVIEDVRGGRGDFCDGRKRRDFWPVDEFRGVHRVGAVRAFSAGRGLRQRGIYSSASYGHSWRRQTSADE